MFVRALASDDIRQFDPPQLRALQTTTEIRDVVGRYGCIRIASWQVESFAEGRIRLRMDGRAAVRGLSRRDVPLPPLWILETRTDGGALAVVAARTYEAWLASAITAAPPAEQVQRSEDVVAHDRDADALRFVRELATAGAVAGHPSEAPMLWAIQKAREAKDAALEVYCLTMASRQARYAQRYAEAVAYADRAADLAAQTGDGDGFALAVFQLGLAQWQAGDPATAVVSLDAAGRLVDEIDDPRIALQSRYMAMYVRVDLGELQAAFQIGDEIVRDSRRVGWREGEVAVLLNVADVQLRLGQDDAGLATLRMHRSLARRFRLREFEIFSLRAMASVSLSHDDAAAALRYYEAARRMTAEAPTSFAAVAAELPYALALLHERRDAEADRFLDEVLVFARGAGDDATVSAVMTYKADVQQQRQRYDEALCYADEAIRASKGRCIVDCDWSSAMPLLRKARALVSLGRRDEAIDSLETATAVLENLEASASAYDADRSRLGGEQLEPYLLLVDLLVGAHRDADALLVAERMHGRSLQAALQRGQMDRASAMSPAEREEGDRLNRRLAELNRASVETQDAAARQQLREALDAARAAVTRFDALMAVVHPALRVPRDAILNDSVRLPAMLRDGALVEYVTLPSKTIAFAVTADANGATVVTAHVLPIGRTALQSRVGALTRDLMRRDDTWHRSARALQQLLLAPLASRLAHRRTLCIVPDGILWRVPFQLLEDGAGQPLVARAAVLYAPSAAMLRVAEERGARGTARGPLIAFGNPTAATPVRRELQQRARGGRFGPLPDAAEEVRALAQLYGPAHSRIYLGSAATELAFRREASSHGILHFATHGLLDDESPMFSALLLAPDAARTDDGLVEAHEILSLNLNAEVAILAACDSGRGSIQPGEGLVGMSWSFLMAGCPTTVVSQWPAVSISTRYLMIELHRHLRQGASPAAALRLAELTIMRDRRFRHPYYWAPFVVVGAGAAVADDH